MKQVIKRIRKAEKLGEKSQLTLDKVRMLVIVEG